VSLRKKLMALGDSAAIILTQDLLEMLGLELGQEVELSVVGRTLVIRSVQESERAEGLRPAADQVFERRRGLLTRLAGDTDAGDTPT
jgi:antitoxin component of MazEF toxin-antitoxin module